MSKSKKAEATEKVAKHKVHVPKSVRVMATMGRMRGNTRKGFVRAMADAEGNYQEWRRTGFKGAWWWQYFKGQDAA
jgi:hypothetical protein